MLRGHAERPVLRLAGLALPAGRLRLVIPADLVPPHRPVVPAGLVDPHRLAAPVVRAVHPARPAARAVPFHPARPRGLVVPAAPAGLLATRPVLAPSVGALFGLFGAMWVAGKRIGVDVKSITVIIGINFAMSFVLSGIDWHAHLGGLIGGAIVAKIALRKRV